MYPLLLLSLAGCAPVASPGLPIPVLRPDASNSDSADTAAEDTAADTTPTAPDTGTGYAVGDVAHDLVATAQSGQPWSLYDQVGTPLILLMGHLDVGAAMTVPLGYLDAVARDAGAVSVVVLGRDATSTVATTDDAAQLAAQYGVDVVLTDPNMAPLGPWDAASAPRAYVIGGDVVIRWTEVGFGVSEAGMRGAL